MPFRSDAAARSCSSQLETAAALLRGIRNTGECLLAARLLLLATTPLLEQRAEPSRADYANAESQYARRRRDIGAGSGKALWGDARAGDLPSDVAERAAHRVAGVRRVANKLVVSGRQIDLTALHRSIEEALERRAHREAGHIELSAHDGVVTLEGRVNSFSDKSVVLDLVRHAPAVRDIDDRLRIEP